MVLELKAELAKIKVKVKEVKNQLAITHLSLINETRHSEKSNLSLRTPFQHKYPFQNPKRKNPFAKKLKKHQKNH